MELRNVWRRCLAMATVSIFVSCGSGAKPEAPAPTAPKAPEAKAESKDAHGHEAKGEDNCITIDIGKHEFLGDMDFDSTTGAVVLTVNNHATGKPHPHAKADAMLNVVLDNGTAQVPLIADPAKEDPEGKTSRYKATAPALKGVKALKGRVNLTIDGKAYLCDLGSGH
jgi:hypothetical protein